MKYRDFFIKLNDIQGISNIWIKLLDLLKASDKELSDEELCICALYGSFLDEGNICLPLDYQTLKADWNKRLSDLLFDSPESTKKAAMDELDFDKNLKVGLEDLLKKDLQKIPFEKIDYDGKIWLCADKYLKAKESIEQSVSKIFDKDSTVKKIDRESTNAYLTKIADNPRFKGLNPEQLDALENGLSKNLIITGGPGTGKTTTVFYLLWLLLKNPEYANYEIKLAAPSGKAADRLLESILTPLNKLKINKNDKDEVRVSEKLKEIESYTIHRLLSFNPSTNAFKYNSENQFPEKTIFVIDESSMIDIILFKDLLQAIPDKARIFILGDKNQLPSVSAGAVLGDLLEKRKASVVELIQSMRFNDSSSVGRLAKNFQKEEELKLNPSDFMDNFDSVEFKNYVKEEADPQDKNPVYYFNLPDTKKKKKIQAFAEKWSRAFYLDLANTKSPECPNNIKKAISPELFQRLDKSWEKIEEAKILCAEREGIQGVENLNQECRDFITRELDITINDDDPYYAGQILMLTQNQNQFKLYNGDTGLVVTFENDPIKYFMVKKSIHDSNDIMEGIFNIGAYIFYPLNLIPNNSIEVSYAITIHKSQGSGYRNIMVFIPKEGHPLLNRQILYTAITRTEGNTYICSSPEALKYGQKTLIKRYTNLDFDK
ncbi:MAG: AAA family ATPase [Treponema sp.]|nr:AAA family ATPase [Treponema sp.]